MKNFWGKVDFPIYLRPVAHTCSTTFVCKICSPVIEIEIVQMAGVILKPVLVSFRVWLRSKFVKINLPRAPDQLKQVPHGFRIRILIRIFRGIGFGENLKILQSHIFFGCWGRARFAFTTHVNGAC